ncbi:MAG TPA: galactosyltransferase-related protein [Steroidobacteraceae bacterium]|nr:galactosyltransferase-related protein [Steroidobacteraceae bacterium]
MAAEKMDLVADALNRWSRRWWPSVRLGWDPLRHIRVADRYLPVSIRNWKLTPWMASRVLARRVARPLAFLADQKLTVLIPYRDRAAHLARLLPTLTGELRRQELEFRIVVVEQSSSALFNRGKLLNIGAHYAAPFSDYYCLHDVDAIPIVSNYGCPSQPLRLVSKLITPSGEAQRTDYYFSGAVSIRKEQFFAANGYSNEYFGWGKEDDDLFFRLLLSGFLCYYDAQGKFWDLPNPSGQQVERSIAFIPPHLRRNRRLRSLLVRGLTDPQRDGLSTLKYEVVTRHVYPEYEHITVAW